MLEALILSLLPAAQSGLASPSSSTQLAIDPVCHDEAILLRDSGRPDSGLYWPRAAWFAQLGDLDTDGLLDTLPGLDALTVWARAESVDLTPHDLVFSIETDFAGFLDGDLLRMKKGGGLEVAIPESEFEQALLVQSGSLDLDAVVAEGPVVWFSVKDKLQTLALGQVEDGDILVLERPIGRVLRLYSEADVQALVDHAHPGSGAIGDVKSLSLHPVTGELVFSVQAPTSGDATIYGVDAGGRLIPGFDELDFGFQVSTELDAFSFLPDGQEQPPILKVDVPYAASGEKINLKLHHATPGGMVKGLMARRLDFAPSSWAGISASYLDASDPTYLRQWSNRWFHPTQADASGSASFSWTAPVLPPSVAYVDHYFQALDVTGATLSNPIVVRLR